MTPEPPAADAREEALQRIHIGLLEERNACADRLQQLEDYCAVQLCVCAAVAAAHRLYSFFAAARSDALDQAEAAGEADASVAAAAEGRRAVLSMILQIATRSSECMCARLAPWGGGDAAQPDPPTSALPQEPSTFQPPSPSIGQTAVWPLTTTTRGSGARLPGLPLAYPSSVPHRVHLPLLGDQVVRALDELQHLADVGRPVVEHLVHGLGPLEPHDAWGCRREPGGGVRCSVAAAAKRGGAHRPVDLSLRTAAGCQ